MIFWRYIRVTMRLITFLLLAGLIESSSRSALASDKSLLSLFSKKTIPAVNVTTAAVINGKPNYDLHTLRPLSLDKLPRTSDSQQIVARVNGDSITKSRFMGELHAVAAQQADSESGKNDLLEAALAEPVLQGLIRMVLVEQYARDHGIEVADAEVDGQMQNADSLLPAGHKLLDIAVSRAETREDIRRTIRDNLLVEKVQQKFSQEIEPATPQQIKSLLESNAVITSKGEEIRASYIVLRALASDTTQAVEAAHSRASEALAAIRGGMDFTEAAKKYSQDRNTMLKGGDLGYFTRGKMFPEFDAAAFALKPGEVSNVVQLPIGFVIIKVTDRHASNPQEMYKELESRKRFVKWQQQALKSAKIEKYF